MTKEKAIKILPDMKGAGSEWDEAIDVAVDALKAQLPSAQPERKIGEWKHISDGYVDIYECNQCGKKEDYERNYCPDCGAYMKKENKIIKKY